MSQPLPPATPGATSYGAAEVTAPPYSDRPVAIRGPESLGGLLLILAGLVAAISLVLHWVAHHDVSGWALVRRLPRLCIPALQRGTRGGVPQMAALVGS